MHEKATGYGLDDLISDFFSAIWQHIIHDIDRHISVGKQQLRIAVTVPALWSDCARQRLMAGVKAGIRGHSLYSQTDVTLLDEPDAAATCLLYEGGLSPGIEVDDAFILCDCGGGMVVSRPFLSTESP